MCIADRLSLEHGRSVRARYTVAGRSNADVMTPVAWLWCLVTCAAALRPEDCFHFMLLVQRAGVGYGVYLEHDVGVASQVKKKKKRVRLECAVWLGLAPTPSRVDG